MKIYSLVFLIVLGFFSVNAQFVNIGGLKGASNIDVLYCSDQKLYAFSGYNIYKSNNDGIEWSFLSKIDGEEYHSKMAINGDKLAFIGLNDYIVIDEFYFYISNNGGQSWEKRLVKLNNYSLAYIDDIYITIYGDLIAISMETNLLLSTNGGKTFKESYFDGVLKNNEIHFFKEEFYFIEDRRVRTSKDLLNFKDIKLNSSTEILYHFKSSNNIYIYDDKLRVLKDSIFESLDIVKDDFDFSDVTYYNDKIYLSGEYSTTVYDESKKQFSKFDLKKYISVNYDVNLLKINNGKIYFQNIDNPESLFRKSFEIENAPIVSISNLNIIRDANIYNAHDVLWHDKSQLAYFDIIANRWSVTPFTKTKNELYGVANKNEIFVKKPQPAIMNLNGLKIRNSNIDSKINTLTNCGDILIGRDEDKKYYGLHKGILPWIEIPIPSSWVNVTSVYSNGLYIIHDRKRDMVISEDGYIWKPISTHSIGFIIDVKKTENGKLMCATQNKIFSLNEISQDWELVPTETLPFLRDNISGFETYKNTLIVSQINGGIAYSSNFGFDWYRWDEGLPHFGFKNTIQSGENFFVNFNGEFYKRNIKEIPDMSALDDVEEYKNSMKLFPVPVKDKLNLLLGSKEDSQSYHIINGDGTYLRNASLNNEKQLDVSDLADGFYFLQVDTPKGKIIGKFIKIR